MKYLGHTPSAANELALFSQITGGGTTSTVVAVSSGGASSANTVELCTLTSSYTRTLPSAPAIGTTVAYINVGTYGATTSTLSIAASGSATIAGTTDPFTTSTGGASIQLEYVATNLWVTTAISGSGTSSTTSNTAANIIPNVAGNGTTDDTAAINAALATPGGNWYLEAGKTYLHTSVLTVTAANVTLTGYGATLSANSATSCGLHIASPGFTGRGLYHTNTSGNTTRSSDNFNVSPFAIDNVANTTLEDCVSENSPASGFFWSGASNFSSKNCVARYSLADGHHVTSGSHDGLLSNPVSLYVGDDMFANVAYTNDASQVRNIRWLHPVGYGQANSGRGLSIVGATYITVDGPEIYDSYQSGIYIAAEQGTFNTLAPSHCWVRGGIIRNCARNNSIGVMLYNGVTGTTISDCHIEHVLAVDSYATQVKNNASGASGGPNGGTFTNCTLNVRHEGSYLAQYYQNSEVATGGSGSGGGVTMSITAGAMWAFVPQRTRISQSSSTGLTTTQQLVAFDTVVQDDDSKRSSTTRLTAQSAGWYSIDFTIGMQNTTSASAGIQVNGAQLKKGYPAGAWCSVVVPMVHLNGGDYVEFFAYATQTTATWNGDTYAELIRVL